MITTVKEHIEAQELICNINAMRAKLGVTPHTNIYWILKNRTLDYLRTEQVKTLSHYNEAVKNS